MLLEIEKSGETDKQSSKELLVNTDPGVGQVLRRFEDVVIKVNKRATMSRQARKDTRHLCTKYSFALSLSLSLLLARSDLKFHFFPVVARFIPEKNT